MPDAVTMSDAEQTSISRRSFLIGAALSAASGIAFARQPKPIHPVVNKDAFIGWIPKKVGPWSMDATSGVILPPQDQLSDRLYDNLVTRVYVSSTQPAVMLLLAYNNIQDGVLQVHRPEVCYPVGGFQLSDARQADIKLGKKAVPANFFTASTPNRIEQVSYFTRVGDSFPRSWSEQRIAVIQANLSQEVPDAMMMRASLLGKRQDEARVVLSQFYDRFYINADTRLQRLLIGPHT